MDTNLYLQAEQETRLAETLDQLRRNLDSPGLVDAQKYHVGQEDRTYQVKVIALTVLAAQAQNLLRVKLAEAMLRPEQSAAPTIMLRQG